ncbi:hypothetical protein BCR32DRAFT_266448 [Anaeromyces robustus]|uniref:Uncharacterized protein n=1 Tax=Anaeromyces robustus TaxID=1754192 RepID=A0A1Y1XET3_9FUNG|nr:hypothetical protein BCR32DRAFT_266448 [Anaeromyces robustus]|eukprot:ORX84233.1 hypothetical protein BCR32DRAFT_266448 [Anaeromyces robustus]
MEFKTVEKQVKFLFIFCIVVQFLDLIYFFIYNEGFLIEKIVYSAPLLLLLAFPSYLLYSLVIGNKYNLVKFGLLFNGLPIYYLIIGIKNAICWILVIIENDVSFFNLVDFTNPIILSIIIIFCLVVIVAMIYSRNILQTYVKKLKTENRGLIGESEEAVLLKMI